MNSDCFGQIKDYTASYISPSYSPPQELPEPFVQNDRIMHLQKVRQVFSAQQGPACARVIRASENMGSSNLQGGKRFFYLFKGIEPFEVSFDPLGKINEPSISNASFIAKPAVIKKIMLIAMERLAKELSWKDTTHVLACNAIDYQFSKDSQEPLQWHCDTGEAQARYSFITLLSDPADSETGWSGGNLLYTTARALHWPEDYDQRHNLFALIGKLPREIFNQPHAQIWSIEPSLNDAILFGNKGMNHKVTPLMPLNKTGERLILTVFDYGTVDEFAREKLNTRGLVL
jgi:hypothetical protein